MLYSHPLVQKGPNTVKLTLTLAYNVAMLQEVHFKEAKMPKLKQRWIGQVFSAPGSGAARVVSIRIAKRISFRLIEQIADRDGSYIIVSGSYKIKNVPMLTFIQFWTSCIFITPECTFIKVCLRPYSDGRRLQYGQWHRSSCPLPSNRAFSLQSVNIPFIPRLITHIHE